MDDDWWRMAKRLARQRLQFVGAYLVQSRKARPRLLVIQKLLDEANALVTQQPPPATVWLSVAATDDTDWDFEEPQAPVPAKSETCEAYEQYRSGESTAFVDQQLWKQHGFFDGLRSRDLETLLWATIDDLSENIVRCPVLDQGDPIGDVLRRCFETEEGFERAEKLLDHATIQVSHLAVVLAQPMSSDTINLVESLVERVDPPSLARDALGLTADIVDSEWLPSWLDAVAAPFVSGAARSKHGLTPWHVVCARAGARAFDDLALTAAIDEWRDVTDRYGRTGVHLATQLGRLDVVSELASSPHKDLEAPDVFGNTPLHSAAFHGSSRGITCLLDIDPSLLAAVNNADQTPLHVAACSSAPSRLSCVAVLLEAGANALAKDMYNFRPLDELLLRSNGFWRDWDKVLDKVLAKNVNVPLHALAKADKFEHIKRLVDSGRAAPLSCLEHRAWQQVTYNHPAKTGETPLHVTRSRKVAAVLVALDGEAVTLRTRQGNTPLHVAMFARNAELATFLIQDAAAPLDAVDDYDESRDPDFFALIGKLPRVKTRGKKRTQDMGIEELRAEVYRLDTLRREQETSHAREIKDLNATLDEQRAQIDDQIALLDEALATTNEHVHRVAHLEIELEKTRYELDDVKLVKKDQDFIKVRRTLKETQQKLAAVIDDSVGLHTELVARNAEVEALRKELSTLRQEDLSADLVAFLERHDLASMRKILLQHNILTCTQLDAVAEADYAKMSVGARARIRVAVERRALDKRKVTTKK